MRKQLTGEPVAGELHTGFGGRGRRQPFPTPILWQISDPEPPLVSVCYSELGKLKYLQKRAVRTAYASPIDLSDAAP